VPDTSPLDEVIPRILDELAARNAARETALSACRALIRVSANSIRAVHRGEFEAAGTMLDEAKSTHLRAIGQAKAHGEVYYAGFVHDAQKEYAEARATLALLSGRLLPTPEDLGVEYPAYLNGLGETIGELRRAVMDRLRRGAFEGCEEILQAMDDIYAVLVTIDYPDAMTGGLRRTTDQARGILEKTRGDLTMAIVQREAMAAFGISPQAAQVEDEG
jgi:translin